MQCTFNIYISCVHINQWHIRRLGRFIARYKAMIYDASLFVSTLLLYLYLDLCTNEAYSINGKFVVFRVYVRERERATEKIGRETGEMKKRKKKYNAHKLT